MAKRIMTNDYKTIYNTVVTDLSSDSINTVIAWKGGKLITDKVIMKALGEKKKLFAIQVRKAKLLIKKYKR